MSELQAYYDSFRTGYWADEDPKVCACGGSGWALSDVDTFHTCPIHYSGQPHPEDWTDADDIAEAPTERAPIVSEPPVIDDEIPF